VGLAEKPHESLDVLGRRCQEELLAHKRQSPQAQAAQPDLILEFREHEEHQLLLDILEQRHRELLKEISHTDLHEFKLAPRKNERLLESILSHLRGAPVQELRG
jgi:hypothetical protein